jgi:hypothetical protein
VGVIEPVTEEYDVSLNPIRGQISETFAWNIAELWKRIDKPIYIYYLGDHDPSGLLIESTLRKNLEQFSGRDLHWKRLAVTSEDFANPKIIGFPVKKKKDSKKSEAKWKPYVERYGDRCVEVDAISANDIRDRVRATIKAHIDPYEWKRLKEAEELERASVLEVIKSLGKAA